MPGTLIERPQMTRTMYSALKRHIMTERQKKKQEQEQDEAMERLRKERELRKKKEVEDNMNLEQTKEQIMQLTMKMEDLKNEKHELFSQLKKVLHQEDESKKKAQLKEQSEMMSLAQQYNQGLVPGHAMFMQSHIPSRTKYLSIHQPSMPQQQGIKRQRTPSPPPATIYPTYTGGPAAKYPPASYHAAVKQESYPTPPKQAAYQPQSAPGTYVTQAALTYQQSAQPQAATYASSQAAASSAAKYPPGQSAFTTYPSHYAQHQKAMPEHPYNPGYPVRGVPQSGKVQIRHGNILSEGYIPTIHSGSALPLQQQLEQANQKSGFSEEKYKLQQQQMAAAGLTPGQQAPVMTSQIAMSQHQPPTAVAPPKGSIMTGFPVRSQPAATTYQQTSAGQVRPTSIYSMSQAPRHPYQTQGRGFY